MVQLLRGGVALARTASAEDSQPGGGGCGLRQRIRRITRQYIVDYRLHNMTVVLDKTDKSNLAFGTTRPPESYVIDKNGMIRRKFIGPQDWSTPEIQDYLRSL